MEALIGGGLNSIADAGHGFYQFQTNWFRQHQKPLTRCLVLATLSLVHFFPDFLFISSFLALICGTAGLFNQMEKAGRLESQRNKTTSPKKQPITDDVAPINSEEQCEVSPTNENEDAGQQQTPNKTDLLTRSAKERMKNSNISPDDIFSFLKSVYVAVVLLLSACFVPTPLFVVTLTAFGYALLLSQSDQHEQQATKLEDIFLQRIALPFLPSASGSVEKKHHQDEDTCCKELASDITPQQQSKDDESSADETSAEEAVSHPASTSTADGSCKKLDFETQLRNYVLELAENSFAILCYSAFLVGTMLVVHYAPATLLLVVQTAVCCKLLLGEAKEQPLSRAELIDRCSVFLIFLVVRSVPIGLVFFMLPAFSLAWLSQLKGQRLDLKAVEKEMDNFLYWLLIGSSPSISTDSVENNKQMLSEKVEVPPVVVEPVSLDTIELSFAAASKEDAEKYRIASELFIKKLGLDANKPLSEQPDMLDDNKMPSLPDNVSQLPTAVV